MANIYFGFPSGKIKVIGVTGTDGKTTTTHLIYHILEKSDKSASMISTIYAKIGKKVHDTGLHTTTPRAWNIQRYLSQAVANGDEFFVMETTSHALDQNRVWGVLFEISVLTNISREHLDYHKTYENYVATKSKLFKKSKLVILNQDDQSFPLISKIIDKLPIKSYSLEKNADFTWPKNLEPILKGDYNQANTLAAYSVCNSLGLSDGQILKEIASFTAPAGRLEVVYKKDFTVIIDFAHTSNSFEKLLPTIRNEYVSGKGRLIHVFGSAGNRDQQKRPLMGQISGKYADVVILTEEDYRNENLKDICESIAEGLQLTGLTYISPDEIDKTAKKVYTIIPERAKAIKKAINLAVKDDVVVSTGKSHEKSLAQGGREVPWDEYQAVENAIIRHDEVIL